MLLGVYNSAGERVRTVYSGSAQAGTGSLTLVPGAWTLPDGRQSVGIDGVLTANGRVQSWGMDNDSGQPVSGGTYTIKMTVTDSFGAQRSTTLAVAVTPPGQGATLEVYNSAGELVRSLKVDGLGGLPTDMVLTGGSAFVADPTAPNSGLRLDLKVGGGTQSVLWDGMNAMGQPAASGTYVVKLSYGQVGEPSATKMLTVTLLQSPALEAQASAASARFAPNPLPPGMDGLRVYYRTTPLGRGRLRVYNLAGELVAVAMDEASSGVLGLAFRFSSGVYVADFAIEGPGGATLARHPMKLAVLR